MKMSFACLILGTLCLIGQVATGGNTAIAFLVCTQMAVLASFICRAIEKGRE